jgi:S1-C subfamily serine protease
MIPLALALLPLPADPVVPGSVVSVDTQWAAIAACPVVSVPGGPTGTGVVVGERDGFAYLLTAAHVAKYEGLEIRFTTREKYPAAAWFAGRPEVVGRWTDPDVALIRFPVPVDGRVVPRLPLAGPGQRPKEYPFAAWAVGAGGDAGPTVWADRVRGKKAVKRPDRNLAFFWETDLPPHPGRSGGPLLDTSGRVIGLCVASEGDRGYYAHLDEILAALKRDGHGWLVGPKP